METFIVNGDISWRIDGGEGLPYLTGRAVSGEIQHLPNRSGYVPRDYSDYITCGGRGVTVESYCKPSHEQKVKLYWGAIDIDWEDNGHFEDHNLFVDKVMEFCIRHGLMLRTSRSGYGLHVIKWYDPTEFDSINDCNRAVRADLKPLVEELNQSGVETCVYGLINLWLYGGAQRLIVTCASWHEINKEPAPAPFYSVHGDESIKLSDLEPALRGVVDRLVDTGFLPRSDTIPSKIDVNVYWVREALFDLTKFNTNARGRLGHEHEPNGFISIDHHALRIWSSSDSSFILTIPNV